MNHTSSKKFMIQIAVVTGLLLLSLVPVAAGMYRLYSLAAPTVVTPLNARFFAAPVPIAIHAAATLYLVLGAFQFVPALRRGRNNWHRRAGKATLALGYAAAISGLWMTLTYPWPPQDNAVLFAFRLMVGVMMLFALTSGTAAIIRRDFTAHRQCMMRAYALGMGAGTQALVLTLWAVLIGSPDPMTRALLMGACWGGNLALAVWLTRDKRGLSQQAAY